MVEYDAQNKYESMQETGETFKEIGEFKYCEGKSLENFGNSDCYFPIISVILGPNLEKSIAQLLDCSPYYINYMKLYFNARHLKTLFNRGW